MTIPPGVFTQHLIDPELCIRCGSCEEHCPQGAISNDGRNYVVNPDVCNSCRACVPDCPTGAISNWRSVTVMHPIDEQFLWDQLPAPVMVGSDASEAEPTVSLGRGAPPSAPHPVENLHTRDRPARATVRASERLTADDSDSEIRHIELDVGPGFPFLEGQSVGILAPGLDDRGRRLPMRLYSVACARDGEAGEAGRLALTVKRVLEDHDGRSHQGLCSNHMCDLRAGDTVEIVGPYGASFLMPDDPQAHLMMIATGTGVAPMRAMIERRLALRGAPGGRQVLFYGGRTPAELPYHDELSRLAVDELDLNLAFSRLRDRPKTYVQDLIRARHELVAAMLTDDACYIYLCGLKGMEAGVLEAFRDVCAKHGIDWNALEPSLEAACRLHIETY